MIFCRYIYNWGCYPNPDSIPTGRFVIDIGYNNACVDTECIEMVAEVVDHLGMTDHACEQLGIPEDEWDLYYKETDTGPKTLLTEDVIYPDFIWEKLKEIDMKTVIVEDTEGVFNQVFCP